MVVPLRCKSASLRVGGGKVEWDGPTRPVSAYLNEDMAMQRKLLISGSVTASQLEELFGQIDGGSLTGEHLQALLEHRNPFEARTPDDGLEASRQLENWRAFLAETFDMAVDPASVSIPDRREGFDRLIVVPAGVTLCCVMQAVLERFKVYSEYTGLSDDQIRNDREPTVGYAVWVRGQDASEKAFANLSANDLNERGIPSITLLERLLYELKYFAEMHEHLDRWTSTLCAGSRSKEGLSVPQVYWDGETHEIAINSRSADERDEGMRARQVIP